MPGGYGGVPLQVCQSSMRQPSPRGRVPVTSSAGPGRRADRPALSTARVRGTGREAAAAGTVGICGGMRYPAVASSASDASQATDYTTSARATEGREAGRGGNRRPHASCHGSEMVRGGIGGASTAAEARVEGVAKAAATGVAAAAPAAATAEAGGTLRSTQIGISAAATAAAAMMGVATVSFSSLKAAAATAAAPSAGINAAGVPAGGRVLVQPTLPPLLIRALPARNRPGGGYTCRFCGSSFPSGPALGGHIRRHLGPSAGERGAALSAGAAVRSGNCGGGGDGNPRDGREDGRKRDGKRGLREGVGGEAMQGTVECLTHGNQQTGTVSLPGRTGKIVMPAGWPASSSIPAAAAAAAAGGGAGGGGGGGVVNDGGSIAGGAPHGATMPVPESRASTAAPAAVRARAAARQRMRAKKGAARRMKQGTAEQAPKGNPRVGTSAVSVSHTIAAPVSVVVSVVPPLAGSEESCSEDECTNRGVAGQTGEEAEHKGAAAAIEGSRRSASAVAMVEGDAIHCMAGPVGALASNEQEGTGCSTRLQVGAMVKRGQDVGQAVEMMPSAVPPPFPASPSTSNSASRSSGSSSSGSNYRCKRELRGVQGRGKERGRSSGLKGMRLDDAEVAVLRDCEEEEKEDEDDDCVLLGVGEAKSSLVGRVGRGTSVVACHRERQQRQQQQHMVSYSVILQQAGEDVRVLRCPPPCLLAPVAEPSDTSRGGWCEVKGVGVMGLVTAGGVKSGSCSKHDGGSRRGHSVDGSIRSNNGKGSEEEMHRLVERGNEGMLLKPEGGECENYRGGGLLVGIHEERAEGLQASKRQRRDGDTYIDLSLRL